MYAARRVADTERSYRDAARERWDAFVNSLSFEYRDDGKISVKWGGAAPGEMEFETGGAEFFVRGDAARFCGHQTGEKLVFTRDRVHQRNADYFRSAVRRVVRAAGLVQDIPDNVPETAGGGEQNSRLAAEESFHDRWAAQEDPASIDVRLLNESVTAPEMRWIRKSLGDLAGKKVLDIGCGLGEASVYFALQGACVTAMDLSQGMLQATEALAGRYGVQVRLHKAAAESFLLSPEEKFDVIYAGNLFHHVDIEKTVRQIAPHLENTGVLVSWDPVAYNPLINIYRRWAVQTRTPDEHPLRMADLRIFEKYFAQVERRWFWLTALLVFVLMVAVQMRNPNKERFWKRVVTEGEAWAWIYRPLARIDEILLAVFPFLGPLCWNVVIAARRPRDGCST